MLLLLTCKWLWLHEQPHAGPSLCPLGSVWWRAVEPRSFVPPVSSCWSSLVNQLLMVHPAKKQNRFYTQNLKLGPRVTRC